MNTILNIKEKKFINASTLKYIAITTMLIDHLDVLVWRKYITYLSTLDYATIQTVKTIHDIGRDIGRLTFPIFCFCIVEGFYHTRSVPKYMLRLFIMGIISEIPFDLLRSDKIFDMSGQNVFFTLLLGLLCITSIDYIARKSSIKSIYVLPATILVTACISYISFLCHTDYSYKGIIAIAIMYLLYYDQTAMCIAGAVSFFHSPYAMLGFIPIFFYNGEKGQTHKLFFYAFYPLHIIFLYIIVTYAFPQLPK